VVKGLEIIGLEKLENILDSYFFLLNRIVTQIKRTNTIRSARNLQMFEKFLQFITDPQKIAQIPEAINAEPTGSIFRIEWPIAIVRTATISEMMKTVCACESWAES